MDADNLPGAMSGRSSRWQASAGLGTTSVVSVVFDVAQIELFTDDRRDSRKIWNHVDESRVDPVQASQLLRNGLRVGVAAPAAWPAVRAILHAANADVRRDPLVAAPGMPLAIKTGVVEGEESIFWYGLDGRLVGKTFSAGDKLLVLDYAIHPELGGCIDLKLRLEIRHEHETMSWQKQGDVLREAPGRDEHVFSEAAGALTLKPDEFVVIGLHDQAKNEYLVGSRFLLTVRSGRRSEKLYLITPKTDLGPAALNRSR